MKISAAVMMVALAVPVAAQWLHYPTHGMPRTPDGKPNLSAPAPRAADGKPDFSGIWDPEKNRGCPPDGCPDMQPSQEYFDIGWGLTGGLPYQPWARDLVKARAADHGKDDPFTHCLPNGVLKTHTTPLLRKIVQVPGLMVILSESNASYRQIFTDGRPLPVDPQPSWNGYSTGKWQGDTLMVETNGIRDATWLDHNGSPLTEAGKITERFRRVNFGHLEIEITVDDPKAYTKPWTVRLNQHIITNTELLDYICLENEKDISHIDTAAQRGVAK